MLVKAREILKVKGSSSQQMFIIILELCTEEFRDEFISDRVLKWAKDVTKLAGFAKEEPQAALI